jgi:hypothetical protein
MHRGPADPEEPLHIGLRRWAADHQRVRVDEGEVLPLPRREAGSRIIRHQIRLRPLHRGNQDECTEVNGLGEFGCKVEPVYSGRKVTAVRLSWWAKNLDERKIALNELRFSRVGRRARLKGEVVTLAPLAGMLPPPHPKT